MADSTAKKIESLTGAVDVISRNRLVIAILLIVDGVTFLSNPDATLTGMAQGIILVLLLATLSIFFTAIFSKTKDIKTIIISAIVLILGACFYFYPDYIATYIQLLLSLFIIYNGLANISHVLNLRILNRVTGLFGKLFSSNKKSKARDAKFKEVDDGINREMEQQANKLFSPFKSILKESGKSSAFFIIVNVISIIFGIVLLIAPSVSMSIWGLIFLYTGISSFVVAARATNLTQKIRERKFKEILMSEEKDKKE